jgi:adenine-specific DNA-methyltransferase
MDKLKMETPDMAELNIEKIGAMFPNVITETVDAEGKPRKAINFELLKQMLSSDVLEGDEAYEFTWVGKRLPSWRLISPSARPCAPARRKARIGIPPENLLH